MTLFETLVAVALIAILLAAVGARYRLAKRAAFFTQMRAETRDLIAAQEAYYHTASLSSGRARYADSVDELAFVPQKHVVIELRGGTRGWAALVTSVELPPDAFFCAVYVGDVEPLYATEEEGILECMPADYRDLAS